MPGAAGHYSRVITIKKLSFDTKEFIRPTSRRFHLFLLKDILMDYNLSWLSKKKVHLHIENAFFNQQVCVHIYRVCTVSQSNTGVSHEIKSVALYNFMFVLMFK